MTTRRRRRNVKNVKMFKSNDDALSYYLSQLKGEPQPKKQVEEGLIFKADSSLTAPYAHLSCKPKYVKENEYVIFDASKSIDCNNESVKKYIFNFGDNTKKSTSFDPIIQHKYKYNGQYIVSLTVIDDFGKRDTIKLVKRIGNVNDYTESESTNENTQNSEYSDDDDDDGMRDREFIRNVSIIAHVDHGKTALTESLTHVHMDVGEEKDRGITIKSAAVSLQFSRKEKRIEKEAKEPNENITEEDKAMMHFMNLKMGVPVLPVSPSKEKISE